MRTRILTMPITAILTAGLVAGAAIAPAPAAAQPYPYGGPGYYGPSYYYYNGRWVDQRRWEAQREREWRRANSRDERCRTITTQRETPRGVISRTQRVCD